MIAITETMLLEDFDAIMDRAIAGERFLIDGKVVLAPISDFYPHTFTSKIEQDADGNYLLRLSDTAMKLLGWNIGDDLVWLVEPDGRVLLRAKEAADTENITPIIDTGDRPCRAG